MKKKIFISHISKETELAQCLKEHLYNDFLGMLDIFVSSDRSSIKLGDKWLKQVEEALDDAGILIILCSKESIKRPWVNFEAGAAWIRKIPVIPICHSRLAPSKLSTPLSMLQGISGNDEEGLKKLYDKISEYLDVNVPKVNFKELSNKIKDIESEYIRENREVETISNPKILCAASKFYLAPELGFDMDVAILEKTFPGCVQVERNLTKKSLFQLLTTQQFDIIHLVIGVDKENGDLIFSEMDLENQTPINISKEFLSANGFANLLIESNTKLVVLATCNALLLAVEVAKHANMAASDALITGAQVEEWGGTFYDLLANGKNLYSAFDLTRKHFDKIPIRAIRQKNVIFNVET